MASYQSRILSHILDNQIMSHYKIPNFKLSEIQPVAYLDIQNSLLLMLITEKHNHIRRGNIHAYYVQN